MASARRSSAPAATGLTTRNRIHAAAFPRPSRRRPWLRRNSPRVPVCRSLVRKERGYIATARMGRDPAPALPWSSTAPPRIGRQRGPSPHPCWAATTPPPSRPKRSVRARVPRYVLHMLPPASRPSSLAGIFEPPGRTMNARLQRGRFGRDADYWDARHGNGRGTNHLIRRKRISLLKIGDTDDADGVAGMRAGSTARREFKLADMRPAAVVHL